MLGFIISTTFIEELRAGDDGFHQAAEAEILVRQIISHLLNRSLIRKQQAASEAIGH